MTDFFAVVGIPSARLVDDFGFYTHVDDLALAADALAKQNVELGCFERRRHFVLDHFDFGFVADRVVAAFDGASAANVQTHGSVELERIAAGGGFG